MKQRAHHRHFLGAYTVGIMVFTLFGLLNTWVYCHNAAPMPEFEGRHFHALVKGWRFDTVVSSYILSLPLPMMIVGEPAGIESRGYHLTHTS